MTTLYGGVNFLQGGGSQNQLPLQNIAERAADSEEVLRRSNDAVMAATRVAIPAQVISFNAEKQTIVAQPLIREKVINRQNGQVGFVTLPQLVDVPVCFPQGGDFVLTMPIQEGDEVVLLFSDLNIDSWWQSGGIQNWNDSRRHDLSDAIAVVGLNSVPHVISNIASDATELRTKDGETKIRVEESKILIEQDGRQIELTSSKVLLKFNDSNKIEIGSTGIDITGTLRINTKAYTLHTHAVTSAPGNTGGVNP